MCINTSPLFAPPVAVLYSKSHHDSDADQPSQKASLLPWQTAERCLCFERLTFAQCWHSAVSWGPNCSCDDDAHSRGMSSPGVCSRSASQVPCCFCAGASERCQRAPFPRGLSPPVAMQTGCLDHLLPAVPAAAPRAECQHPEHKAHAQYRNGIVHCFDMLHQTMKCVAGSR